MKVLPFFLSLICCVAFSSDPKIIKITHKSRGVVDGCYIISNGYTITISDLLKENEAIDFTVIFDHLAYEPKEEVRRITYRANSDMQCIHFNPRTQTQKLDPLLYANLENSYPNPAANEIDPTKLISVMNLAMSYFTRNGHLFKSGETKIL